MSFSHASRGGASDLRAVEHVRVEPGMSVGSLLAQMERSGVLGAGKLGKAASIVAKMFSDPGCSVFLSLAGALVPGGLRLVIRDLVEEGFLSALVTTGANVVHDILEALGFRHYVGSFRADDARLREERLGRIGDIYVEMDAYVALERWLRQAVREIPRPVRSRISGAGLLKELGLRLDDEDSIVATAARHDVPIICPGLVDSVAGFQLWSLSAELGLRLDPFGDLSELVDRILDAERVGLIVLGGGMPKHFLMFATTFRDGADYAIQITTDRPEPGGLSGAPLEEAISWGKIRPGADVVTVICDATIAFPLIVAAALERAGPRRRKAD